MQTQSNQAKAVIQVAKAVCQAIMELGAVPSGHLYAALTGQMPLGARLRASAQAGSVVIPWEHGAGVEDNHMRAARR